MLKELLDLNRNELIRRCRAKSLKRFDPGGIPMVVEHGVPLFLEQLAETLGLQKLTLVRTSAEPAGMPATKENPLPRAKMARAAALHGVELLHLGYSVDQVVHHYGDVCQAITEVAIEQHAVLDVDEFRTLNLCLDDVIADAVTAFGHDRELAIAARAQVLHEKMGVLAEEQRRLVDLAIHTFAAIKTGNIAVSGATGTALINILYELRLLIEQDLPTVRLSSGMTTVGH
jgi:hypothetical protein